MEHNIGTRICTTCCLPAPNPELLLVAIYPPPFAPRVRAADNPSTNFAHENSYVDCMPDGLPHHDHLPVLEAFYQSQDVPEVSIQCDAAK